MTYQVQNSDNSNTFIISDNVVDDGSLSLALIGRNVSNYGQYIARNTIHHLENFASAAAPPNPLIGQLWYDKTPGSETLRVWDGGAWSEVGGANALADLTDVVITSPTLNQVLKYNGTNWVNGTGGSTGTVTSVGSGTGLTGGPITTTGSLSVDTTWLSAYIGSTAPGGGGGTGDIESVTAGGGLSGGGLTGAVTVNVGAGDGIIVNPDTVAVNTTWLAGWVTGYAGSAGFGGGGGGSGTVTSVGSGSGLINGPITGSGSLAVGAGTGITVNPDDVSVNVTWLASWVTGYAGSSISLNSLSDVTIGTLSDGQVLKYDNASSKWINGTDATGSGGGGSGTVTSVDSGAGLTGGPITGSGTLAVGAGTGIIVNPDDVAINTSWLSGYVGTSTAGITNIASGRVVLGGGPTGLTSDTGLTFTAASNILTVGGNVEVTGNVVATQDVIAGTSDDRLKTRETNIVDALSKVEKLNGFFFTHNHIARSLGLTSTTRQVGVSAQEVNNVLPEVIAPAPVDPEYMTVRYEKLVPLLIEAIKELSAKVKELEGRL